MEEKEKNLGGRPRVLKDRILVSLNVESEKKRELEEIAKVTGIVTADLMREGIDLVLAKYRK